jgi:hypothetical protein
VTSKRRRPLVERVMMLRNMQLCFEEIFAMNTKAERNDLLGVLLLGANSGLS